MATLPDNLAFNPADFSRRVTIADLKETLGGGEGPVPTTWENITGKPATFPPTIGTSATTAKAGNYSPPAATTSAAGVVKLASSTVQAATAAALGTAADRTYMSQVNADGQLVVNVPWVNTTYTLPAAGTVLGGVRRGVAVADATEETVQAQLNALLASLRTAGVLAT